MDNYTEKDIKKWEYWAEKDDVDTEALKRNADNLIDYIADLAFTIMGNRCHKVFNKYDIHPDCSGIDSGYDPDCIEHNLIEFAEKIKTEANP